MRATVVHRLRLGCRSDGFRIRGQQTVVSSTQAPQQASCPNSSVNSSHQSMDIWRGAWDCWPAGTPEHLQGTVPVWVTPADATLENQQPLPSRIGSLGSGIKASPWEFTSLLAQVGSTQPSTMRLQHARSTQMRFRCTALH